LLLQPADREIFEVHLAHQLRVVQIAAVEDVGLFSAKAFDETRDDSARFVDCLQIPSRQSLLQHDEDTNGAGVSSSMDTTHESVGSIVRTELSRWPGSRQMVFVQAA
jgi:Mg/Co/Ni transporter MgtE